MGITKNLLEIQNPYIWSMAKILLTGCAGFIGSHTAERLLEAGHEVIGIDNFSKFYSRSIKERNMSGFINHPSFTFHKVDIRDKKTLFDTLTTPVNIVVHLAAKAGVRPSIKDPKAYIEVNVNGTHNILQWMVETGCKKFFFASSSSIYGNQKSIPFKEDEVDDKPISPYAATKRSAELMNFTYHHLYHIDIINARFFTVYGPRQRPDLAIHKFTKLIDENASIEMYGDGSTARDYTYISDTVSGIFNGANYLLNHNDVYETINLGNNTPVKLSDLIETLYRHMEKQPEVKQMPMQEGDVDITFADISRAKSLIGYSPEIPFNVGIAKFVDWYKSIHVA